MRDPGGVPRLLDYGELMEQPLSAKRALGAPADWRPAVVFWLLVSYFGCFGAIVGGQGVLWADVIEALRLSKTSFGFAQLIAPLISVGLLLFGGQLAAWIG